MAHENDMPPAIAILYQTYPRLNYYLDYSTPFQLVIAAILSPQVRDEIVNKVTPKLFKKYPTPAALAKADEQELTNDIKPVSFANAKAKNLIKTGSTLHTTFNDTVPRTLDELTQLAGVGEKTAHAILQNAFDIVEGICVDTHVLRVAHRMGLTTHPKNANKTETELKLVIPKTHWKDFPWLMKAHGRALCTAPVPDCMRCPIKSICPKTGVDRVKAVPDHSDIVH